MIQLRSEHLAAFENQYEAALVDRVVRHVQTDQAAIIGGFPQSLVREMVENGLARARRYGLTWESSLTAFVSLMFQVAPNFDEQPAIHRVLTDKRLSPNDRIDALLTRVRERHWRDAQRHYNERAWFPELYDDDNDAPLVRIRWIRK